MGILPKIIMRTKVPQTLGQLSKKAGTIMLSFNRINEMWDPKM
jgi:hypothetical protein